MILSAEDISPLYFCLQVINFVYLILFCVLCCLERAFIAIEVVRVRLFLPFFSFLKKIILLIVKLTIGHVACMFCDFKLFLDGWKYFQEWVLTFVNWMSPQVWSCHFPSLNCPYNKLYPSRFDYWTSLVAMK